MVAKKKANSTHRFFKTKSSDLDELLNADRAELLKNLWVRQFDASVKPTERVKKGIYPVRGVAKDTEENLLIFLEIAGVLKLVRYTKENVKLSAKADDEPDDEADEDE